MAQNARFHVYKINNSCIILYRIPRPICFPTRFVARCIDLRLVSVQCNIYLATCLVLTVLTAHQTLQYYIMIKSTLLRIFSWWVTFALLVQIFRLIQIWNYDNCASNFYFQHMTLIIHKQKFCYICLFLQKS